MLAMLALVLLFRTLIPAGYMIAPSAGGVALTLCESVAPPASAHHRGHEAPAKPKQPCAYAALAAPALPPAPPLIGTPPPPPDSAAAGWIVPASISPEPASLPPPSTGPPYRV
jgi:hypothetical protein